MKRFLICVLVVAMMVCVVPAVSAQDSAPTVVSETVEYFDDGSYIVTTVTEETAAGIARAGYTKTGSKTVTGYANDNTVAWSFTVTGTFVVNEGVVSACNTARYSHTIVNSAWSLQSGNAAKTGNQAVGSATFIRKLLGVTVETRNISCTVTCDKYGVIS